MAALSPVGSMRPHIGRRGIADNVAMSFTNPRSTNAMPMAPHGRAGDAVVGPRPRQVIGTAMARVACLSA